MEYYIGLMSGTSADGVDAVLVDFSKRLPKIIATEYLPYPAELRNDILSLCQGTDQEIERLGALDNKLGYLFAESANRLIVKSCLKASAIKAIGSHGQTVRHRPNPNSGFTLQIGNPNIIAAQTGVTTISDFRRKDMAHGGQGAPLAPAFHHALFKVTKSPQIILNIGGIANITLLDPKQPDLVIGYDTGPGNGLLDAWIHIKQNHPYDKSGKWAASGKINSKLLSHFLSDSYFSQPPPKSTGREYFNIQWLQQKLEKLSETIKDKDVQATLLELTAISIIKAIKHHVSKGNILICGGGAHNHHLLNRLQSLAGNQFVVDTTESKGIHPDWVEATAFAWLAKQTLNRLPGNHISVTGASKATILGGIYYS